MDLLETEQFVLHGLTGLGADEGLVRQVRHEGDFVDVLLNPFLVCLRAACSSMT